MSQAVEKVWKPSCSQSCEQHKSTGKTGNRENISILDPDASVLHMDQKLRLENAIDCCGANRTIQTSDSASHLIVDSQTSSRNLGNELK